MLLAASYVACTVVPPITRPSCGAPLTITASPTLTVAVTTSPALSSPFCAPTEPVSATELTAGAVASTLIVAGFEPTVALRLPAVSVCRTPTAPAAYCPSASVKLVPVPALQVEPALVLYSQVAPVSSPLTFTVPIFVNPSVRLTPVSLASDSPGTEGATVSTMKLALSATCALVITAALPAASVIAAPLSANALAAMLIPLASVCPARIV